MTTHCLYLDNELLEQLMNVHIMKGTDNGVYTRIYIYIGHNRKI